jgi:outer membrane biosynthesis protein TonB
LEPSSRRRPSTLDDRTLVPAGLVLVPLETESKIPASLPLESIAERFVVPRDVKPEAYAQPDVSVLPPQPSDLDERITVPLGAALPEVVPPPAPVSDDLVEKDVFLTGEVNFLANEEVREKLAKKSLLDRAYSILLHAAVLLLLIFQPKLFSRRPPTAADQEIARKGLVYVLPPGAFETAPPTPRVVPPQPKVKVDPRILRKVAPPEPEPAPAPQPLQPKVEPKELPSAPAPKPNTTAPPPAPTPKQEVASNAPAPKLEAPDAPTARPNLNLPKSSSNPLRDTIQDLSRNAAKQGGGTYAPDPRGGLPPGLGGGRQGAGGPGIGMGPVQILTPTEGVDFNDYIQRVIASVRRNWYAVMPESAQLGDKGIVVLEFSIRRDGSVPGNEPDKLRGSGKEPLDRAAISSIRSSNPFDHLPSAFSGPEIRLRFIFLYNLPVEAAYQ